MNGHKAFGNNDNNKTCPAQPSHHMKVEEENFFLFIQKLILYLLTILFDLFPDERQMRIHSILFVIAFRLSFSMFCLFDIIKTRKR